MGELNSFQDLWENLEQDDSYWTEKAILDFSIELHNMMKRRRLTKKDFAEKIDKSQAYVTKVFRGNANFTIETMVKLSRALDGDLTIHVTPKEEKNIDWYRVIKERKKPVLHTNWAEHAHVDVISAPHQCVDVQAAIGDGLT